MSRSTTEIYFRTVESKWDDEIASDMDLLERLVYRSNLLGSDAYINNTGGGNTSSKLKETDPLTDEEVEVVWVKGSGGDLRTAKKPNFASLYQQRLLNLQDIYQSKENTGLKTPAEDSMTEMYPHCTFNLNPRAPSIDTPLHSFIPYKFVDHTHPVPVIAIATANKGPQLTKEIYGDDVVWVDWMRPGFELGLKLQETIENNPGIKGIVLGGHGLINWANDDKECYELSLELINQAADYLSNHEKGEESYGGEKYQSLKKDERRAVLAEVLPFLRGQVSQQNQFIGTIQDDDLTLQFINSKDAPNLAELGTSCPDHFLRTKIKPLYVEWNPQEDSLEDLKSEITSGLEKYREDYADYYNNHSDEDSPDMRDPNPTVILIPGLGMVTWGKNKSESRVTAEFYTAAIGVMRGAESVAKYTAISKQEAYDIEYWALEEAKLQRMPPEAELSRQIIAVIGAGSGIGKDLVPKLIDEGATVIALDLKEDAANGTAKEVLDDIGMGIGVAGSGISGSGDIIGLECDITDRKSVQEAMHEIVIAYGGLDNIAVTAGLYPTPDQAGNVSDSAWDKSFSVNVKGNFIVADEASKIWKAQNLKGSMVITTSANAVVPKAGSFAYDTSKSAANHLVRELAISLAPNIRVNGVAPATVVEGSSMFPRDRVKASLTKYGIEFSDEESTESLRDKLAEFYASRTLTKKPITLEQQTEAIFQLLSTKLENTSGHIIPVDGGLKEAFLR
ncbi:bifunctional rhamnulose-1-phosphate aldolase/short-chain dehydrogenase [Rhodohalobacter sulfatireducens]|uniref:Bifunctional rhamnulose-1-phosphate aldolase/short-chain dehydrogenase n=1 Tax=Rhodohalobacter sulfatireducens TaxID=2911366 RepID=A0ABS9KFW5_9BACT|nr:bifunctional rhamnulose-1-phosphate aldolase/short-chain dehydrogenase [Rhodohalobacter sulfatireducens]MCG2589749.1 bifunctional rhamnulose-1-phosphate aldolase/short-chain dehydrogenase [Rhodohalobacter sulfatireducens]